MSTYGQAQKEYYERNKHLLLARQRKYKKEYNKLYYKKNKAKLLAAAKAWKLRNKIKDLPNLCEASFKLPLVTP